MVLAIAGEEPLIINEITELLVRGAFDRGIPNQERIVLQANATVDLGQFALLLGIRQQPGFAVPLRDNFFWFGDGIVSRGDWIFVYTGPGEGRSHSVPGTTEKLYTAHWGRKTTVLSSVEVVPIIVRFDGVQILVETEKVPNRPVQKLK